MKPIYLIILFAIALTMTSKFVSAQTDNRVIRIAKIAVDPTRLKEYDAALKEQMSAAIKLEPGVLSYYAVADKLHPEQITILEIYANQAAYEAHVQTAHFKKYKATVEHMVKSLQLTNVDLIAAAKKPGL